jgi:hypothetical protein
MGQRLTRASAADDALADRIRRARVGPNVTEGLALGLAGAQTYSVGTTVARESKTKSFPEEQRAVEPVVRELITKKSK